MAEFLEIKIHFIHNTLDILNNTPTVFGQLPLKFQINFMIE